MSDSNKKLTPAQQKEIDKINQDAEFRMKVEQELMANADVQKYLEQFSPTSASDFINTYITYKCIWYRRAEFYYKQREHHDMQWIEAANEHLENIQQKKLFDLQCLWRANNITLEGIDICYDFQLWEWNILNCPCVDPITRDEVELYQQYLAQDNAELENTLIYTFISWQSYDQLKEAYNSGNARHNFPEWYDFYNSRKGTGVYMSLPDIRGEKERHYLQLSLSQHPKEKKAIRALLDIFDNPDKPILDEEGRQHISIRDDNTVAFFVSKFEDKLTQQYYNAYRWNYRNYDDDDELKDEIYLLAMADEEIPVEDHYDWRQALKKAVHKYKAKKIAEALTDAFEQYQLNVGMNIAFPENEIIINAKEGLIKAILNGRRLCGEPEDLNF